MRATFISLLFASLSLSLSLSRGLSLPLETQIPLNLSNALSLVLVELISPASNEETKNRAQQTVGKEPIDSQSVMMNQSSQRRTRVHSDEDVEFDNVFIIEDLILEILLRVPAIYVLRFKCVSKKWYSLISNPNFLHRHSSLQFEKRTDLLIHGYSLDFYKPFEIFFLPQDNLEPPLRKILSHPSLSLFPENHTKNWKLHDSCNGLLLLYCYLDEDDFTAANNTYYIFNLITKQYFKLPATNPIPNIREEHIDATSHIMFDPFVSLSYKVIKCWLTDDSEIPGNMHCQCQLYSSETGSWRLLSTNIPMNSIDESSDFDARTTLLNGVLYWSYWCTPLDVLYCFDVEKESGSFLPLPPKPIGCDMRACLYFGECGGRLRLIEKYYVCLDESHPFLLTLPCSFDIMEMDLKHCQDGRSPWILKYHVNMEMGLNCPVVGELSSDVMISHCYKTKNKGGEEEDVLFLSINQLSRFETSVVSYNLTSNTFGKELTVSYSTTSTSYEFMTFFPFTSTLFPIS